MILHEGKTQEELMQVLQNLDDLTSMDSLVKNDERLSIECTRKGGRLRDWQVSFSPNFREKPISVGTTYNRFSAALDKMQQEGTLFNSPGCTVLCYLSTVPHRDWNGDIHSHWAEIEPGMPYEVVGGTLKFKTKEIIMSEAEYAVMSKTGLAFYNETNDVYYPFTETAYLSLSRLLDSAMAFRNIDSHLLGTALIIAEKIASMPELRIIYRSKNEHICPVLSVVGNRYKLFSQKKFFETVLNHAATKLGIYEISNWVVADEVTSVTLEYAKPYEDFFFRLTLSTGDTQVTPFCASLEAVCEGAVIPLIQNKARHTKNFSTENIEDLLSNMSEKMEEFRNAYVAMSRRSCYFDAEWLNGIHKTLGKKRVSELKPIDSGYYHAIDIWNLIVKTRFIQIPGRQTLDLKKGFHELFYNIVNNLEAEQATA